MLAKPDMVEIIALKLVAYGNTAKQGNTFNCQHGSGECQSDALELCTQYKLSGDINSIETGDTSLEAWPFILCMEEAGGNPAKGQSCYENNMSNSTLSWSTVSKCADEEYTDVQTAAMNATPNHQYVPWCLVDGELLENTNMLQKAICDAYTGTPPASCGRSELKIFNDKVERSYPDTN